MGTGKFLQRAALAGAVAIPLAASSAVVLRDDSDERVRCDGCGETFFVDDLTTGEGGMRLCAGCFHCAAPPSPAPAPFDRIQEDDGDL